MTGLQHLQQLDDEYRAQINQSVPSYARIRHTYRDKTSALLTRSIMRWLELKHHWVCRINTTGRRLKDTVVVDVLGRSRIMPGKWIPGSTKKGTADLHAIINGKHISIEIKIGKDRMSEHQHKTQEAIQNAGGIYWVVHTFEEFYQLYQEFIATRGV